MDGVIHRRSSHCAADGGAGDGYCLVWNRFDRYNRALRSYAKGEEDVSYCDIEGGYYARTADGSRIRYRSGANSDPSVSAREILAARPGRKAGCRQAVCSLFANDGVHPTRAAYRSVWGRVARAACKAMGRS